MSEANKALARRWFDEVWNKGNQAVIHEMYHPQGRVHGFPQPDAVLNGPDEFKTIYDHFRETFSDIQVAIDELIAEDNKVAGPLDSFHDPHRARLGLRVDWRASESQRSLRFPLQRKPHLRRLELPRPHEAPCRPEGIRG